MGHLRSHTTVKPKSLQAGSLVGSWFGTFRLISFYPLLPSSAPSSLTPRPVAPALPHSGHSPEACPQMAWGSSSPLPAATSPPELPSSTTWGFYSFVCLQSASPPTLPTSTPGGPLSLLFSLCLQSLALVDSE